MLGFTRFTFIFQLLRTKYLYFIIWLGKSERCDWFFLGRDNNNNNFNSNILERFFRNYLQTV